MPDEIVYEDSDILVTFCRIEGDDCFVTFTGVGDHHRKGFGQDFINKSGYSGLFFISKKDHWYQTNSMPEALARAAALLEANRFKTIIAYGASMGGYGALANSEALHVTRAIIFAPQYSIDAAKVPFEKRWRAEAKNLTFAHDNMPKQISKAAKKTILFDPVSVDRLHADLFAKLPNVELLSVPMGGHIPTRMLQDIGLLNGTVKALLADELNHHAFFADLHKGRRKSKTYWQALADTAGPRRPAVGLHALDHGLAMEPKNPAMLLHRANLLTRLRRFDDAFTAAEAAVAELPKHPAAWRALSNASRSLGRAEDSVSAARKAVELRPKDADLWRVLQEALMLAQDYDGAVTAGQEAISLAPNYPNGYWRTAQALREQGQRRAVEMLAKAVALAPANQPWAKALDEWRGELTTKPT